MSNWPGHFLKTEKREAASGLASTIAMEAGQTFPLLERKILKIIFLLNLHKYLKFETLFVTRWLEACNTYSCDDGVVSSTQHVCNQQ